MRSDDITTSDEIINDDISNAIVLALRPISVNYTVKFYWRVLDTVNGNNYAINAYSKTRKNCYVKVLVNNIRQYAMIESLALASPMVLNNGNAPKFFVAVRLFKILGHISETIAVTSTVMDNKVTFINLDQVVCKLVKISINYSHDAILTTHKWLPIVTFRTIKALGDRRFTAQIKQPSYIFVDEKKSLCA